MTAYKTKALITSKNFDEIGFIMEIDTVRNNYTPYYKIHFIKKWIATPQDEWWSENSIHMRVITGRWNIST